MTRIQIDLDEATANALVVLAAHHNQRPKNFVEYLVGLQVGTIPPPTVMPIKFSSQIPAKDTRQEVHREEPRKEQPKEKPEQKPRKEPTLESLEGITPRKKTALENAREPRQELPEQELRAETRTEATQEAKPWKPNRNDGDYKTKASDRIYTDGTSYRMNLFGSIYYFQTLAEAEAKRDK